MSSSSNSYETLYGVSLLDDLHNYFPAILYDSGRFQSVQQLLHYVQLCTRERFDLFSFGQRSYLTTHLEAAPPRSINPNSTFVSAPAPAPPSPLSPPSPASSSSAPTSAVNGRLPRYTSPEPRISAHIEFLQEDLGLDNQALSLLNLMNVLSGISPLSRASRASNLSNSFLEPVVIRPTAEQIESGSTRAFPSEDTTCAICQDAIPVNQMARRLNVCGHTFHISCIDQWFGRDVRCPTCRHDVREPASQTEANENDASED